MPVVVTLIALSLAAAHPRAADGGAVSFEASAATVDVYDHLEVVVRAPKAADNPFRDTRLTGEFRRGGEAPRKVDGFCDADDGSVYRIRLMPSKAGRHTYDLVFRRDREAVRYRGAFEAAESGRSGLIRVDRGNPWHLIDEGTDTHVFWNGATAFFLLGWEDDRVIARAIDRLAKYQVNRLRVALCGRAVDGRRWGEPLVVGTDAFRLRLDPWPAERPESVVDPGFDVTRFRLDFWRKAERMVRHAAGKGVVVSFVFFHDGQDRGVDPFGRDGGRSDDETRYFRYALARLGAFPNVMWDLTGDDHRFRTEPWVERRGRLLKEIDPYGHLVGTPSDAADRFRSSPWADLALYNVRDEAGGHDFLLKMRKEQAATGRPIPQINEAYGYEEQAPPKGGAGPGPGPPSRSADTRRRLAWGIYMAGAYQTTGERADRGTGRGPDSGGGWINGRGDETMTMLEGFARIVDCFRRVEWWRMEPSDDLVDGGAYCLAEPGKQYLVYLPRGGTATLTLPDGVYRATWFDPRTGTTAEIGPIRGPRWTAPERRDGDDWALIVRRDGH